MAKDGEEEHLVPAVEPTHDGDRPCVVMALHLLQEQTSITGVYEQRVNSLPRKWQNGKNKIPIPAYFFDTAPDSQYNICG